MYIPSSFSRKLLENMNPENSKQTKTGDVKQELKLRTEVNGLSRLCDVKVALSRTPVKHSCVPGCEANQPKL